MARKGMDLQLPVVEGMKFLTFSLEKVLVNPVFEEFLRAGH